MKSVSAEGFEYWFMIGGGFKDSPDDWQEGKEVKEIIGEFQDANYKDGIYLHNVFMRDATEFMKRQKYVDMAKEYDVDALLIVDSDEYVYENKEWDFEKNWEKFRRHVYSYIIKYPQHNVYSIRIIVNEYLGNDYYGRVWTNLENMNYVQNSHYKFGNIETDDVTDALFTHQTPWGVVEGITLKHDHTLRSDEDMKNRREYQDFLVIYERLLEQKELTGGEPAVARRMALNQMAPFSDNCICLKCFKMKGMTTEQVIDPRPRDKRQKDPYVTGVPL